MSESSEHSPTPKSRGNGSRGRGSDSRTSSGLRTQFVDVLGWVVLAVWVASMALDPFLASYDPPPVVHGLMTIVVTAAFGAGLIKKD